ncbi:hypothetical protein KAX21_04930, partial [candidate division WOR-3 bacterium]|nr:hypothetical protein [candidate division WOR-3 bacterium]
LVGLENCASYQKSQHYCDCVKRKGEDENILPKESGIAGRALFTSSDSGYRYTTPQSSLRFALIRSV